MTMKRILFGILIISIFKLSYSTNPVGCHNCVLDRGICNSFVLIGDVISASSCFNENCGTDHNCYATEYNWSDQQCTKFHWHNLEGQSCQGVLYSNDPVTAYVKQIRTDCVMFELQIHEAKEFFEDHHVYEILSTNRRDCVYTCFTRHGCYDVAFLDTYGDCQIFDDCGTCPLDWQFGTDTYRFICTADCGSLTSPSNGAVSTPSGTIIGQTAVYVCSSGYQLSGAPNRTCMNDSQWSGSAPTCEPEGDSIAAVANPLVPVGCHHCVFDRNICNDFETFADVINASFCYDFACANENTCYGTEYNWASQECTRFHWLYDNGGNCSGIMHTDQQITAYTKQTRTDCSMFDLEVYEGQKFPNVQFVYEIEDISVASCLDDCYKRPGCYDVVYKPPFEDCYIYDDCSNCTRQPSNKDIYKFRCSAECGSLPVPFNGAVSTPNGTTEGQQAVYVCNDGYQLSGDPYRVCQNDTSWSGSAPNCLVVDCGAPHVFSSIIGYSDTTFGNEASYYCNAGTVKTVCDSDGNWQPQGDPCVDCGNPPQFGEPVTYDDTTFQAEATYYCLDGPVKKVCDGYGTWQPEGNQCLTLDCGSPPVYTNGLVNYTNTTVGSVAVYECETNYTLHGSATKVCDANGTWTPTHGLECRLVDCGSPPQYPNALENYTDTTVGSEAVYVCFYNYVLSGSSTKVCAANGTWFSASDPVCSKIDCGNLTAPTDGEVSMPSGTTINQVAIYECDVGHQMSGDGFRICLDNSSWSGSAPTCSKIDCGSPPVVPNAITSYSSTTYESEARYDCDTNYILSGARKLVCDQTGTWYSSPDPACSPLECPYPAQIMNGDVKATSLVVGAVAYYSCYAGYSLLGSTTATCTSNGDWDSDVQPECSPVDCGNVTSIENGNVTYDSGTLFGDRVNYTCNTGYVLTGGNATRECNSTGAWSGTDPTCVAIGAGSNSMALGSVANNTSSSTTRTAVPPNVNSVCPVPESISKGNVVYTGLHLGAEAMYSCIVGYSLHGPANVTCSSNDHWLPSPKPGCLPVDCGNVTSVENGNVNFDSGTLFGDVIHYTCNAGYNLTEGSATRECNSTGDWSGIEPQCVSVDDNTAAGYVSVDTPAPVITAASTSSSFTGATISQLLTATGAVLTSTTHVNPATETATSNAVLAPPATSKPQSTAVSTSTTSTSNSKEVLIPPVFNTSPSTTPEASTTSTSNSPAILIPPIFNTSPSTTPEASTTSTSNSILILTSHAISTSTTTTNQGPPIPTILSPTSTTTTGAPTTTSQSPNPTTSPAYGPLTPPTTNPGPPILTILSPTSTTTTGAPTTTSQSPNHTASPASGTTTTTTNPGPPIPTILSSTSTTTTGAPTTTSQSPNPSASPASGTTTTTTNPGPPIPTILSSTSTTTTGAPTTTSQSPNPTASPASGTTTTTTNPGPPIPTILSSTSTTTTGAPTTTSQSPNLTASPAYGTSTTTTNPGPPIPTILSPTSTTTTGAPTTTSQSPNPTASPAYGTMTTTANPGLSITTILSSTSTMTTGAPTTTPQSPNPTASPAYGTTTTTANPGLSITTILSSTSTMTTVSSITGTSQSPSTTYTAYGTTTSMVPTQNGSSVPPGTSSSSTPAATSHTFGSSTPYHTVFTSSLPTTKLATQASANTSSSKPKPLYLTPCLCSNSSFSGLTQEEIIEQLVNDVKIDESNTKLAQSKLKCAEDERGSAKGVGWVGVSLVAVIGCCIVSVDLLGLFTCPFCKK